MMNNCALVGHCTKLKKNSKTSVESAFVMEMYPC